jgi:hypothetical protein
MQNVITKADISVDERVRNTDSHYIVVLDDRYGCEACEISPSSAWKMYCPAQSDRDLAYAKAMHPAGKGI